MNRLKNIPLVLFKKFLVYKGLKLVKTEGGHEKWYSHGLLRPVIIQTHVDPVPEFIVRNCLKTMGSQPKEFLEWVNHIKNGR